VKLENIQLNCFRNIAQGVITPALSLSVITGRNGSGKSSLLEAIHYLGFGRSFRTNKHQSVIQHEKNEFSVFARCCEDDRHYKLGYNRNRSDQFKVSINGEHSNKLTDLVSLIPVQLFTPQSTDLVIGSPAERRRFCDWGLFHVEQSYSDLTRHYGKILRHRNALVKSKEFVKDDQFDYWQQQLCLTGEKINEYRHRYVEELKPIFDVICSQFLPEFNVEVSYYKGWEKDLCFSDSLNKKLSYDVKIGHTSVGPHKADLRFKVNAVQAQDVLSRGQLRMAVAALQLAQTRLFTKVSGRHSIFLLDDIGAELDLDKRERFIDGLIETKTQVFVTAIEKEQLEFIQKYKDKKMFHVEHGSVNEE
jgi:DNA replication and repair protein RecF